MRVGVVYTQNIIITVKKKLKNTLLYYLLLRFSL